MKRSKSKSPTSEELSVFLREPRSCQELSAFCKRSLTPTAIRRLTLPRRFALLERRSETGVLKFVCDDQGRLPNGSRRIWRFWRSPHKDPYLWIQFGPQLSGERIRVVPLSDVHYGADACDIPRLQGYLDFIKNEPDTFTFLNGDIIENAIDGSIGGAVYESHLTPHEQIFGSKDGKTPGIVDLLRPIAHKILWAIPGNHEARTTRRTNLDPLYLICRELGVPYFDEPVFVDLLAWQHTFTFYCQHGKTGSFTDGGKLNAAMRPTEFLEHVDFMVMGHVHHSMFNPVTRIVRKREFTRDGKLKSIQVEQRKQYTMICPAFYLFFGAYPSRAGYRPGSMGSVSCTLYSDGTCRVSE